MSDEKTSQTQEIEVKFYPVGLDDIRRKLQLIRATRVKNETLQRRYVFKDSPFMDKAKWKAQFLRVRHEGDGATITLKSFGHKGGADDQFELEVTVGDFEKAVEIFKALGLEVLGYQESKRETWKYGNVQITVDQWPGLEPFIEIEGPSLKEVQACVKKLKLNWDDHHSGAVGVLYKYVYDIDVANPQHKHYFERLTFDDHQFKGIKKIR
jgi:adenylate cyclase class 2